MSDNEIYDIIEKYDGSGDIDECIGEIETLLEKYISEGVIKKFETFLDTDVFDSCGLDIYYISVAWIDNSDELHICGSRLTSH